MTYLSKMDKKKNRLNYDNNLWNSEHYQSPIISNERFDIE